MALKYLKRLFTLIKMDVEEPKPSGTSKDVLGPEVIDDNPFESNIATEIDNPTINTRGGRAQAIDHLGIVSSRNFSFGSVSLNGTVTRTASGWADITGMSISFSLKRVARVLFIATVSGRNTNNFKDGRQLIRFDLDGTVLGDPTYYNADGIFAVQDVAGSPANIPRSASYTFHRLEEVAAGDHIIKLQHRWDVIGDAIVNGGPNSFGTQLTYLVLGR